MKFVRIFVIHCIFIVWTLNCKAQSDPAIQSPLAKIIPPGPEAFSIGKYGSNPIGLHTGTVRYTLPLFNVSVGTFQLPISLSYSSNGVKVDEVAGRVGIQWRMDFAGVINRTIVGAPDEACMGQYRPPTHDTSSYSFYQYLKTAGQNACGGPFKPDQFSYSVPGYTGKFIFNGDSVIPIPYNNIKIKKIAFGFYMVTPDGTQYYFGGGATEMSSELIQEDNTGDCNNESFVPPGITAWYLTKIILPTGQIIEYMYEGGFGQCKYLAGITQTYSFEPPYNYFIQNPLQPNTMPRYKACIQQLEYNPVLLKEIRFENSKIRFSYSTREDIAGEAKLDSIVLVDGANNSIKKYSLGYQYSINNQTNFDTRWNANVVLQQKYPNLRKRLFLTDVKEHGLLDSIKHQFTYKDFNALPPRLSYSQDYWGFFNGQQNEYLFPANTFGGLFNPDGMEHGGDRDGRFEYSQKGILDKIIYPTGGYSEYTYEPVTQGYNTFRPVYDTLVFTGSLTQINYLFETQPFLLNPHFGIPKLKMEPVAKNLVLPDPNGPQPPMPDTILIVELIDKSRIGADSLYFRNVTNVWNTYEWKHLRRLGWPITNCVLRVSSQYDSGVQFTLRLYNPKNVPHSFMPTGLGVRVKEVRDFDGLGNQQNRRKFKYNGNLWSPEVADWQSVVNAYKSPAFEGLFCSGLRIKQPHGSPGSGIYSQSYYTMVQLHSSSQQSLYSSELGAFTYPSVAEEFLNSQGQIVGGTEYRFLTAHKSEPVFLTNQEANSAFGGIGTIDHISSEFNRIPVPGATFTNTDLHDGTLMETKSYFFDSIGIKRIKAWSKNYYSKDTRFNYKDTLYNIRMDISPADLLLLDTVKYYGLFNVNQYFVLSNWLRIDSIQTIQYEGTSDSLVSVKSYSYGNLSHMQPTRIKSVNSRNQTFQSIYKFPSDFAGLPIYDSMIRRHIITPLIEQVDSSITASMEVSKSAINYASWHSNKFYLPATIQKSTAGQALDTEATILRYDTLGNILEYKGIDGIITSIVYGYGGKYPVAKISGKTYNEVISQSGVNQSILNNPVSEAALQTELSKIRGLANCFVSSYTYKPLVGISSETDTNGRSKYYEYDAFNRLYRILDNDKKVLKQMEYKYNVSITE